MKILLIESFLQGDYDTVRQRLSVIVIIWVLVGIAIAVDLFVGYRKAKQRKEARTSCGLRKTVDKTIRYYALMIIGFLFDCIIYFFFKYPIATFVFAFFIFAIELKSIYERADVKTQKNELQVMKEILEIVKNKNNLPEKLCEMLENKTAKNEEDNE